MFKKILIANRGEIALRVMRTARNLGIKTVAVYSEADRHGAFVEFADEAIFIGPAQAAQSYLRGEKILAAAERTGAEAIHPGYGFLSENAQFAKLCAKAGIVFIGPKPEAIIAMGSKSAAKDLMVKAGVPVAPGYQGEDQSVETFLTEAEKISYPVLLKAVSGGGGKGMRLVERAEDLPEALASAQREAKAAFGDDRFLIEKFIGTPRHVEVQVFGDSHGNMVHLFERDCSVQRRHQKVIEEAPAPNLPDAVRAHLHEAAIKAARAVDYMGAGTVEFLYDGANQVYFMEMNTRLQVEHPVTEEITGIDLVEWQLLVAAGEALPLTQDQITCTGHAFEARIYAEDPNQDYRPSIGPLHRLTLPAASASVRIDSGVREGDEISPFYDPMILKLITSGKNRPEALSVMARALEEVKISGVTTNTGLLQKIASHDTFAKEEIDTHFIERYQQALIPSTAPQGEDMAIAAIALLLMEEESGRGLWHGLGSWRINLPGERQIFFTLEQEIIPVEIVFFDSHTQVSVMEEIYTVTDAAWSGEAGRIVLGEHGVNVTLHRPKKDCLRLWHSGRIIDLHLHDPMQGESAGASTGGDLTAPMPGTVTALLVEAGIEVSAGETLMVMEAMKMEYAIKAPSDGTVKALLHGVGAQVTEGAKLVEFEASKSGLSDG